MITFQYAIVLMAFPSNKRTRPYIYSRSSTGVVCVLLSTAVCSRVRDNLSTDSPQLGVAGRGCTAHPAWVEHWRSLCRDGFPKASVRDVRELLLDSRCVGRACWVEWTFGVWDFGKPLRARGWCLASLHRSSLPQLTERHQVRCKEVGNTGPAAIHGSKRTGR